jgi:hypothetical protein
MKKEKGASLLITIILLSLFLAISLALSNFVVQQIKAFSEIGFAIKAFYIADSGIEKTMLTQQIPPDWIPFGEGAFKIFCECKNSSSCPQNCPLAPPTSTCLAQNFCLKSIGEYKGFRQAIEVEF